MRGHNPPATPAELLRLRIFASDRALSTRAISERMGWSVRTTQDRLRDIGEARRPGAFRPAPPPHVELGAYNEFSCGCGAVCFAGPAECARGARLRCSNCRAEDVLVALERRDRRAA